MQNDLEEKIVEIRKVSDIFEKARRLDSLLRNYNIRLIDLSKKLGMKPSYICHYVRLNRLPEMVVDGYYSSLISQSHLFIISRLKEESAIIKAYEKVLADNLTVAQTDELVREMLHGIKTEGEYLPSEEKDQFITMLKRGKNEITAKIIQTRIKGKFLFEVKGNPAASTRVLKKLMGYLKVWKTD